MVKKDVRVSIVRLKNIIYICNIKLIKMNQTIYQLIKVKKDNTEKIVLETGASSIERAMDYFYFEKPRAYSNKKYRISIKQEEHKIVS